MFCLLFKFCYNGFNYKRNMQNSIRFCVGSVGEYIATGFSARSKLPCFFCLAGVQTGSICGGPIKVEKENQDVA